MTGDSSRRSWTSLKAEAARSESQGIGAPDEEALFASQEGAKWPTVLVTGAGYYIKAEAAHLEQELYIKQNPYYLTVIGIFIYNSS